MNQGLELTLLPCAKAAVGADDDAVGIGERDPIEIGIGRLQFIEHPCKAAALARRSRVSHEYSRGANGAEP